MSKEQETTVDFEGIKAKLAMAQMALDELTGKYEWDYVPTPQEAYHYGTTVHPDDKCTENEKRSWEYMYGYKTIMWLVNVARDYMTSVSDEIGRCAE